MKLGVKKLSSAVQLALSLGAVIAVGASSTAFAQDQSTPTQGNTNPATPAKASTLQTVVVTGSHIRRVDLETASPVVTIDRAAIQASGKLTLGDLVQDLPAVTGGNTNPSVNNSGGTGASSIGLRGLGPNRTLILVDGHRVIGNASIGGAVDPNSIPAAMIDHIDVLTTGASSVYGSDAVGGVVNFILRKDYQGAEFSTNFGQSDHNDGEQQGYTFTFGQTSDKGSIMGGVDYNKTDGIEAGNRKFSRNSLTLYGTNGKGPSAPQSPTVYVGGSSSAPNGHIQLAGTNFAGSGICPGAAGTGFAAHNPGAGTDAASDYHCFQNNGPNSDKYNYATVNLILTPQERTNAFLMGTYNLTDHISAYMDLYVDKTSSNAALAPDPLTTLGGFQISAQNAYNPFGVDYANGANSFGVRLTSLGLREQFFGLTTGQVHTGFKGDFPIGNQTWQWDVGLDYGHTTTTETTTGLVNLNILNQAAGPSFVNAQGVVTCGTAAAPISGCIPFNPFDINTPQSKASLLAASSPGLETGLNQEKIWHADFNGGVFDLPAGTVNLAIGADYRQEYEDDKVDGLLQINPATGTCTLGSQCSSALQGGYNVKEAYAEAFFPILNDLPFAKSLNIDIGDRYSKFNLFGTTNNLKVAVEWKPFDDLLLRGTVAEVFRAPNLGEYYGAPTSSAFRISSDPCTNYNPGAGPANPACVNVPTNGTFVNQLVQQNLQGNAIVSGAAYAGFPIKPEQGKTFDFGAVYSPSWAPGLSSTIDFWHLYLNNVITTVGVQSELNLCAAGDLTFCQFIDRQPAAPAGSPANPNQGQLTTQTLQPTGNLGTTSTGGVDFSLNYKLPEFSFGKISVGLNATYLKYFNEQTAPGTASNTTYNDAGHFMPFGSAQAAACPGASGNCLFPRWKGQGYLNWQNGNWDASWRMRYIGRFQMGSQSPSQDVHPDGSCYYGTYCTIQGAVLKYGATVYNDVSLGYNIEPLNTRVEFGVNNIFDKQPPMLYANNTLNANTDPSDFDLIGRFFFGRVTVKF